MTTPLWDFWQDAGEATVFAEDFPPEDDRPKWMRGDWSLSDDDDEDRSKFLRGETQSRRVRVPGIRSIVSNGLSGSENSGSEEQNSNDSSECDSEWETCSSSSCDDDDDDDGDDDSNAKNDVCAPSSSGAPSPSPDDFRAQKRAEITMCAIDC